MHKYKAFRPKPACALTLLLGCIGASGASPSQEEMWEVIKQQQRIIEELKGKLDKTEAKVVETDEKVEAAAEAIEDVSPAPSWADRVHIGGYGSIRGEVNDLEEESDTFTFRRFVLTADAHVTDRLQTYLELEFERFAELELEKEISAEPGEFEAKQVVEGTDGSEIALEQAWARYVIDPALNFEMGAVLVPLGRFNILHDDNQWNLTRRPLVDRGAEVLPSPAAWPELGIGFTGGVPLTGGGLLDYRLYAVNGVQLDLEFEQEIKSEDGMTETVVEAEFEPSQGTFSKDLNDGKAVAGRLAYKPVPGHEIAVSGYYGRYTPEFLDDESVWSVGLDGLNTFAGLELEYEFIHTDWGDVEDVIADFERVVPTLAGEGTVGTIKSEAEFAVSGLSKSRTGYWLEMRYPLQPTWLQESILGRGFANPLLEPTFRFEQVFFNGVDNDADLHRATLGLAYRPLPTWAFALAGEYTWTNEDSLDGLTNFINAAEDEDDAFAATVGVAFAF